MKKEKEMEKETNVKKEVETKKKSKIDKKTVLTFVSGLLIGAIITTGIFLIIRKNDRPKNMPDLRNMDRSGYTYRERPNRNNANRRNNNGGNSVEDNTNEKTEEKQNN